MMRSEVREWMRYGASSVLLVCLLLFVAGCKSPARYRADADKVAGKLIAAKQKEALGHTEPFTVERPSDTLRRMLLQAQKLPVSNPASYGTDRVPPIKQQPEADYPRPVPSKGPITKIPQGQPLHLTLVDALEVAARNSRQYQDQKEAVFRSALDLSLEIHNFANTYQGIIQNLFSADQTGNTFTRLEDQSSAEGDVARRLKSGANLSAQIILDVAELLSSGQTSTAGLAADASVTIPLLRGSGRFVTTEPLTQAERNVIYAIWGFERFKRTFAVSVVGQYLSVLETADQVVNAENNYANQIIARRLQEALNQKGRVGQDQLDQARQAELSSRNGWISAQQRYQQTLDSFKISLGLPTDARIELDRGELDQLQQSAHKRLAGTAAATGGGSPKTDEGGTTVPSADAPVHLRPASLKGAGPYEIPELKAIRVALEHRLDLRIAQEQVYDAQRKVAVAADALRAGLSLVGTGSVSQRRALGSAGIDVGSFDPQASYSAGLKLDLPFERTAERNAYRNSYISFEQAARSMQAAEDSIKQEIRNDLRDLLEQRTSYGIQVVALQVARRRVDRTKDFLKYGRSGVTARDVNEAQAAMLQAQNFVTSAVISYHLSELNLQRDMGVLRVNAQGMYKEINPNELN